MNKWWVCSGTRWYDWGRKQVKSLSGRNVFLLRVAGMRWCGSLSGICGIRTNSVVLPVVFHKMFHAMPFLLSYRAVVYCSNYHISCTILCNRLCVLLLLLLCCASYFTANGSFLSTLLCSLSTNHRWLLQATHRTPVFFRNNVMCGI